jgi:phospholipase C
VNMPTPPQSIHHGWLELATRISRYTLTRRRFLATAATGAGVALSGLPLASSRAQTGGPGLPDQAAWTSTNKIKHVVILCQENRTFDHYFGAFSSMFGRGAKGFDPAQLAYSNGAGITSHPYHLTAFCNRDPDHTWEGSHAKWNSGAMNGWVTAEDGELTAIGYFEAADHIYHVQLAQAFTLADHYFCAQIGPTLPNRLYLWSGTSGWAFLEPSETADTLPYNNPPLTAPPPVLSWPTLADVLDAARLPWKCYSVADGSLPSAIGAFNPLIFFSQVQTNPLMLARATADISEFFADLAAGTLPAVSWIVTEAAVSEHPPAPPDMGQLLAARVVDALMGSSAWDATALFLTYDEGGGFFDHIPPQILEHVPATLADGGAAVGPAFRVPLIIVSPWARSGTVFKRTLDHTSILQFVERTFSTKSHPLKLPTIDARRRTLADLRGAFDFRQAEPRPALPTPSQLIATANQTLLTLDASRTVASCSTTLPSWLLPLLGV